MTNTCSIRTTTSAKIPPIGGEGPATADVQVSFPGVKKEDAIVLAFPIPDSLAALSWATGDDLVTIRFYSTGSAYPGATVPVTMVAIRATGSI
jgi:hypothetical protein